MDGFTEGGELGTGYVNMKSLAIWATPYASANTIDITTSACTLVGMVKLNVPTDPALLYTRELLHCGVNVPLDDRTLKLAPLVALKRYRND